MSNELEKDLNDEVYEDSFYDNEEELVEEEEKEEKEEKVVEHDEEEPIDDGEARIAISFACEDCDYRWDDVILKSKDNLDEDDDITATCPMCGSMNVSQI